MGIIDAMKSLVGGDPHDATARAADAPDDEFLGTQLATPGSTDADVATPETDPMASGIGTAGLQPGKPTEIEREPDPEHLRSRE